MNENHHTATFAAGCFWGVESKFRDVRGVEDACVGYTGGHTDNPTYQDICTGTTGHAEAVQVIFDSEQVSFEQLIDIFWQLHDPTTLNRQGPDIGTQYRSAIFTHSDAQYKQAEAKLHEWTARKHFSDPITTQIDKCGPFFRAEEYHQQYFDKMGRKGPCYFT